MFQWKKEFELGITSIDTQHQILFEIGNKIYDLLIIRSKESDDYDEIKEIISELEKYVICHFKTEENLLEKYNYPDIEAHKKEHAVFATYLEQINEEDIQNHQTEFLKDLFDNFTQWIFNHIITTDYLYKDYLLRLVKKQEDEL
ncbi:MAG: bacteriohemerythrin [Lachnotalea sp.]